MARTREVIEIPPPRPAVITERRVLMRSCPHCRAWRTPSIDAQAAGPVLGQGRIGQRLAALIAPVRYPLAREPTARLPVRAIQGYPATPHWVGLSVGASATS